MKTLLLLSAGMGLFAVSASSSGDIASWTQIGAVSALGLAVLVLVGRTIPTMVKNFTEAIVSVSDKYAKSIDDASERQVETSKRFTEQQDKSDTVLRELSVQVARRNKDT